MPIVWTHLFRVSFLYVLQANVDIKQGLAKDEVNPKCRGNQKTGAQQTKLQFQTLNAVVL